MKTVRNALLLAAAVAAPAPAPAGEILYATTTGGRLVSFDSDAPGSILSNVGVTGVAGNLVGIDFRPATGLTVLYGLGVTGAGAGTVYTIDVGTGAATAVTAVSGVVLPTGGPRVSIDFDPVADALRVVTGTGQNVLVSGFPTGTFSTAVQTPLTLGGATPNVVGIAYSNINIPQTAATFPNTLLAINNGGVGVNDANIVIDPPAAGTLTTVVANLNLIPGFDVMDNTDIDASLFTSTTYATINGGVIIAQFSPASGFSVLGTVGGGFNGQLTSIAVSAPVPEPTSMVLLAVGAAGATGYARRRRAAA